MLDTLWVNAPRGVPGNDDLGAMSAWAVWAMLGLYPETPGRAELVVGGPMFTRATVHRPGGDVVIRTTGAGAYVQGLKVNGAASGRPWLPESFALRGGVLDFQLGAAPDRAWGAAPEAAPPSWDVKR